MEKFDKEQVWRDALQSVKLSVSPAIFQTWLSQTHLVSLQNKGEKRYSAEVGCPSAFIKSTVEKRYFGLIQDALIKAVESPVDLIFLVKAPTQKWQEKNTQLPPLFDEKDTQAELRELAIKTRLRPGFTFSNFAVSDSNQMAHAAAEAVAQKPGINYNPLFIWGGVGVGKTHLMHAVGYRMLETNMGSKIIVCTGEEFTNDIVEGIRNKTTQKFRDKYRKANALFIDDIQFIAGKDAVQNEFFHTFNAVTAAGGQIILTSDKPPTEIAKLEDRLRSRFEAGLIVDVAPPDFELRCAITQIKAREKELDLSNEIVHMIAGNMDTARKIEGLLVRLSSEVKLKNAVISEELIQSLVGANAKSENFEKRLNPDSVMDAVCKHYSISRRAMTGKARARIIARPRQVLMYLLRTELGMPLEEVGRMIGGRDHSTVIHAVDKITKLASQDINTREDILQIKNNFGG